MTDATTPMMRQYRRVKGDLPEGVILFFRLGDFYEMFFEDAQQAAPLLDIALTRRNGVPMCGVPAHSLDGYVARLVRAGRKVAICDQVEDPALAKGIVRRELARIVTPGTATESAMLEADRHNYLAGIQRIKGGLWGTALLDLSTGRFLVESAPGLPALADILKRAQPVECVAPAGLKEDAEFRRVTAGLPGMQVTAVDDWTFEYETARDLLIRHFGVHSLEGYGCEGQADVVGAAGAVLYYVKESLRHAVNHIRRLERVQVSDGLILDEATCANLDLVRPRSGGRVAGLLDVLDVTRTAMGARLMRDWLVRPPAVLETIRARHDAVEQFIRARALLNSLRDALAEVRDLERLIARIGGVGGNARDVLAIGQSLRSLPGIRDQVAGNPADRIRDLAEAVTPEPDLVDLIGRAIVDEPPLSVKDGGMIRAGYHAELDALRKAASEGRQWLAEYQVAEQARTGIKTLKVRHNRVFGFYIEVSKGQAGQVPPEYLRKQTLVNAERFTTPELKTYEARILGAQEKAVALELELLTAVRDAIVQRTGTIQATAAALAELDVLAALADRALALGYTRPVITTGDVLRIRGGRHPVVEQMPDAERFVPNDTELNGSDRQIMIITGPNMAGKSTYIRQVALIAIMAHMGSFVPADSVEIGLLDRVFTRVGASDDLARGRSTFLVEMQETANILNHATPRSLIVLDEIGRGTSTFDGVSIAWAVAEYLHQQPSVKAKTLFATHYHELTDLALTMPGCRNYNIQVREQGDRIVFLRKIVPGGSDKSYGIHVAQLAGMPAEVIERSREILANLEEGELGETGQPKLARPRSKRSRPHDGQLSLFGDQA